MILEKGNILGSVETMNVINRMKNDLVDTLGRKQLNPSVVIEACDKLANKIMSGDYDELLNNLLSDNNRADVKETVIHLLNKESLTQKLEIELGNYTSETTVLKPVSSKKKIKKKLYPLGVLFHIAAGNVDGLPAYSVVEGLLAGNINILKLPSNDNGISIKLLSELIQLEPILANYIYVFDTPSSSIDILRRIANLVDGIVVWGGDLAIEAARQLVRPSIKLIEWGHKISFAYITEKGINEKALTGLAKHMLETKQILCSSCQGIYLDTDNMDVLHEFGEKFIGILNNMAKNYPSPDIGCKGQISLLLYNKELEGFSNGQRILKGTNCSVMVSGDDSLETSIMFGNCWIKPLSRQKLVNTLYHDRGYLQTAGLLCAPKEKEELCNLLSRAGVDRITDVYSMSKIQCGEAHDGVYPLQRYTRMVQYY